MRAIIAFVFALSVTLTASPATARDLPRRPFVGIAMSAAGGDATAGESGAPGVIIDRVIDGSSAEKAGLRAGDGLISLDGKPVESPADVTAAVRRKRVGQSLRIELSRDGRVLSQDLALVGLPREGSSDFDTDYGAVEVDGTLRRTIVTRPKSGNRHPAILFVGGIGCYPADSPLDENDTYRTLLSSLTRQGFVTMRVEKSGMGDSEGPACMTTDLQSETRGYVAGLEALKAAAFVDVDKVFIVGHSIGGIVGPLVAAQSPVRGIVAMAAVGTTWFEYELINRRRQLKLAGTPAANLGRQMMLKQWCMHRLLIDKQAVESILAERAECADEIDIPSSPVYLQQIAALDLPALWAGLGIETLLIYGSADYLTRADEHQAIADVVNAARPGAAQFVEISDLDHYLTRVRNQKESFERNRADNPAPFHDGLAAEIGGWLLRHTR